MAPERLNPKLDPNQLLIELQSLLRDLRRDRVADKGEREKLHLEIGEIKAVLLGGVVNGPRALTTRVEDLEGKVAANTARVAASEKRDTTSKMGIVWAILALAGTSLISSSVGGAVVYFAAIAGK